LDESRNQFDAKVNAMEEQMKNARERRKAKIEKRIHEVKEEYQLRTDKLKLASEEIQTTAKTYVL
jgi:ribosome recycling factor